MSNSNVRRCATIHLGSRRKRYISCTLVRDVDSPAVYSRYISVAIIALLVALTVACAGPEAEKAIFVARETTAVKAEQTDRKVAAPATSELKPSDQQTDANPTTDVSTPSVQRQLSSYDHGRCLRAAMCFLIALNRKVLIRFLK